MSTSVKGRLIFKTISVMVTGIFLWNQIAWAGGTANQLPAEIINKNYQERVPGISPDDIERQDSYKASLISLKNDIENFTSTDNPPGQQTETLTYYNDADGRLETMESTIDDPGSELYGRDVKFYYLNEASYIDTATEDEWGRVYRVDISDGTQLEYYYEIVYENPSDIYDDTISMIYRKDPSTGDTTLETSYYLDNDNRIKSTTFMEDEQSSSITYYFLNEDWDAQGYGRADYSILERANENNEVAFDYEYYTDTDEVKYIYSYSDGSRTQQLFIYEYDTEGNIVSSTCLVNNKIYTYTYTAQGEISSICNPDGIYEYYDYYYTGEEVTKIVYLDTTYNNLIVTEYYDFKRGLIISAQSGQGEYTGGVIDYDENALDDARIVYSYSTDSGILTRTGHADYTGEDSTAVEYYIIYRYDVDDNLISVTGKLTPAEYADQQAIDSRTTAYSYGQSGDILSAIDPDGSGYRYEYTKDADGVLLEKKTLELEHGILTVETYNGEGKPLSYNEGSGHWDANSQQIVIDSLPSTAMVSYTYSSNPDGGYTREKHIVYTDAEGNSIDYTETTIFDADDNITYFEDGEGNAENFTYDSEGRGITEEYTYASTPLNKVVTYSYENIGQTETVTETRIVYADSTRTETIDQTQIIRTYEKNALGKITSYTEETSYPGSDRETVTIEKIFDSEGVLTGESLRRGDDPAEITTYSYTASGEISVITRPGGRTETYSYDKDSRGNITQMTLTIDDTDISGNPYSVTEVTCYDADTGLVTSFTDKDGNVTTYERGYDTIGNLVSETETTTYADSSIKVITKSYDAGGNLVSFYEQIGTDPAETTTYTYNQDDTLASVTYPDGRNIIYAYEYHGNGALKKITETTTEGENSSQKTEEYNTDGDLVRTTDTKGSTHEYTYERSLTGKLTQKTKNELDDAESVIFITQYNGRGDVIYYRDVHKNLERVRTHDYVYAGTEYEYVSALTEITTQTFEREGQDDTVITFSTTKQFNSSGQILSVTDNDGNEVSYSYYADGEAGGKEGDLKEVLNANGRRIVYMYEYAQKGYLSRKAAEYYEDVNGEYISQYVTEEQYDADGRVTSHTDKYGVTRTYTYTLSGNVVTSVVENVSYMDGDNPINYSSTKNYSSDGERLESEILPDGTSRIYTYDAEGRLTRLATGAVTIDYSYNSDTGVLEEAVETDTRETDRTSDDITKVTCYFGEKEKEQIRETRTFKPGAGRAGKPAVREVYHYNSQGVLEKVITKKLKSEYWDSTGDVINENEYEDVLETFYGIFKGNLRKKREITRQGWEDFVYDEDGLLVASIFTDGRYLSKTKKVYNYAGDIVKTIREKKDSSTGEKEEIVTEYEYDKDATGLIVGKTETATYNRYDGNDNIIENIVLFYADYTYYIDKTNNPIETSNHEIKTKTVNGKTSLYVYGYDELGYLLTTVETVTWTESGNDYTLTTHKKFNQKGDIIASIDEDGTYSEYTYPSEENEMGGRIQAQKLFFINGLPVTASSLDSADTTGATVSEIVRTYDFDNDLIKIEKKNGDGTEDDQVTEYLYEKDSAGNILKKYEYESGRSGYKVYEYDLKGDLIAETDRNGITTFYAYTRYSDSVNKEAYITSIQNTNSIYADYIAVTNIDKFGNIITTVDENDITRTYTYTKNTSGIVTGKIEYITKIEDGNTVLDYTESYNYDNRGAITSYIDKNGMNRGYTHEYDAYGNVKTITETVTWDENGTCKIKETIKEYNLDGTIKSITYKNDPDDNNDDITKTYTYTYDSGNGTLVEKREASSRYSAETIYVYNLLGDIVSVTSPRGITTSFVYERDEKGCVIKRYLTTDLFTDAIEIEEYDSFGNKISYTDANGYVYTYQNSYDLAGNLTEVVESHDRYGQDSQLLWSYTKTTQYDTYGRIISSTDRNGVTLTYTYDINRWGEVTASYETDARYEGQVIRTFDPSTSDLLSITDRMCHGTKFEYTYSPVHGGIIEKKETEPLGGTRLEFYDVNGRIYKIKDKHGKEVLVTPEFDSYGNMIRRALDWTERIKETDREFQEVEYYSVDGDLVRRIDYLGNEYEYQYERDSLGNLKYMTEIASSFTGYDPVDVNPVVSVSNGASGSELSLLFDGVIGAHATVAWTEHSSPGSFVIDLGENTPEYDTIRLYLRTDNGSKYPYKVFAATDPNDTLTWTLLADRTPAARQGLQEIEFDTLTAEYILVQGYSDNDGQDKHLQICEVQLLKRTQVSTVNLTTTGYSSDGRIISKAYPTGKTVHYSYDIGGRGEVTRVYEGYSPDGTVGVLYPLEIKSMTTMDCNRSPDTSLFYDDDLSTRTTINWGTDSDPASIVIDLTGTDSNIADISALGIGVREGTDRSFGYKIYYATSEAPSTWVELVDRSDEGISRMDDWRIERFDAPVSARYIRLQGGYNSLGVTELDLAEVKVYQLRQKKDVYIEKEVDEWGRTVVEKNALMRVWEDRKDLQEIFAEPGKEASSGYWAGKKLTDWARIFGAEEDPRIRQYLHDYDNKTLPEIKEAFTRGDISHKIVGANVANTTYSNGISAVIDGDTDSCSQIEWSYEPGPVQKDVKVIASGTESALYLDGNDYLRVGDHSDWDFGTGDFTIDFRFKPDVFNPGTAYTFLSRNDYSDFALRRGTDGEMQFWLEGSEYKFGAWQPAISQWYHIAVVRSGDNLFLFIDGTQHGVTKNVAGKDVQGSSDLYIGSMSGGSEAITGSMREVRISSAARWTGNFNSPQEKYISDTDTSLLLHLDESEGSTSWSDSGNTGHSVTGVGGPVQATTESLYPETKPALCLDGNDYLSFGDDYDWDFAENGDFTVELWARFDDTSGERNILGNGRTSGWLLHYSGSGNELSFWVSNTKQVGGACTLSENTWYHLAVVRKNGVLTIYVDGTSVGSVTYSSAIASDKALQLGVDPDDSNYFAGSFKEVRISGIARYDGNFSPQSAPFNNDSDTRLLLHLEEQTGSTSWSDSSGAGHEISSSGDPGYYLIELSEDTQIDKIRLSLPDSWNGKVYKYRIYTSLNGVSWGDAFISEDREFVAGWQEYVFAPITTRYLKIEGAGARSAGGVEEFNQLDIEEFMIFDSSCTTESTREYDAEDMKDWSKNFGFKKYASLIKFARTAPAIDEPEIKTYSYIIDTKGTVRCRSEMSLFSGSVIKFFDEKGYLIEEIHGDASDSGTSMIECEAPDGSVEIYDLYGGLLKTIYREYSPDDSHVTGYQKVEIAAVGFENSANSPEQSEKDKTIDGKFDTYVTATWSQGGTPASMVFTLKDEENISRIRFRLWDNGVGSSYTYRIYVKSAEGTDWAEVADRSQGTYWNWQDISFDEQPVKYIKVSGDDVSGQQTELSICELEAYEKARVENISFLREYNADGNLIAEKNILGEVWEEDAELREYFATPASSGTGVFSGWTLERWAAEVGSRTDLRLTAFKRRVNEFTAELEAVLNANPDIKAQYTNDDGTINEYGAVNWAKGCDKGVYPELIIYDTDISGLDYPYLATYSYIKEDSGFVVSRTRFVNFGQQTLTTYYTGPEQQDTPGLGEREPALCLDGNDSLRVADHSDWDLGINDFTIDFWFKPNVFNSGTAYTFLSRNDYSDFALRRGTDGAMQFWLEGSEYNFGAWQPEQDTWQHIAVVRDGDNLRFYINGTQYGPVRNVAGKDVQGSADLYIGSMSGGSEALNGWMKEIRVSSIARWTGDFTVPEAQYTSDSDTKLLLHLDEEAESVSWTDSGSTGHTVVSGNGDPRQGETESMHEAEAESVLYLGASDYLRLADHSDWDLGTDDFTMDFWFKPDEFNDNTAYTFLSRSDFSDFVLRRGTDDAMQLWLEGSEYNFGTFRPAAGKWYHMAIVRSGDSLRLYVNGTQHGGTKNVAGKDVQGDSDIYIGCMSDGAEHVKAYMKNVRIEKGNALWLDAFFPPAEYTDYTATPYTKLLLYLNEAAGEFEWTDSGASSHEVFSNRGEIASEQTTIVNATREEYTYDFYANGNVENMTIKKSGSETGESSIRYNYRGDMTAYDAGTQTYDYRCRYDKWHNLEMVSSESGNTMVLTNEEVLYQQDAERRIKEYFRAMLYRDPTAEELAYYMADWERTGFSNLARELIWKTDEYISGGNMTYEEQAFTARDDRISASGITDALTAAQSAVQNVIDGLNPAISAVSAAFAQVQSDYDTRKDENDSKYIIKVYRQELGREWTGDREGSQDITLEQMRSNGWTIEDIRQQLRNSTEYTDRQSEITSIINALYDINNNTGLLKDYLDAGDKQAFLTGLGYEIQSEFLVDITLNDITAIIDWLKSQDNHFGRSAVESLYKQLTAAGMPNVPDTDELSKWLIFIDIITGVITPDSRGTLLISMHSLKKVAHRYGLDLYGTAYDIDEFLSKFDEITGFSAIIQYNGYHFLNVTGVVKVADVITEVQITNGYIDGVEQTKNIAVEKFREYYEGNILSTERSDYDKRLIDKQLMNIKGAGWWERLWRGIEKFFQGVVKAVKKVINYIIEPIKQFINAIKYAASQGKWGRVFGAIGTVVVGSALAVFMPGAQAFAYTIVSTAMSMATAICYGEYTAALKSFALGAVAAVSQWVFQGANFVKGVLETVGRAVSGVVNKVGEVTGNIFKGMLDVYNAAVDKAGEFGGWMRDIFGRAGHAITNVTGGLVTGGISRYIGEEIDKTSNWLGKIGIGLAGAAFLLPVTAFANPAFDLLDAGTGHGWPDTEKAAIHMMTELTFETANQLISQETYKALEDEFGEEWYADLLRSSVNAVISAGINVVKQATHQVLIQDSSGADYPEDWTDEDKTKFEEKLQQVGQEVNTENARNPEENDKNVLYSKEEGKIQVMDERTEEVLREITYKNGEFETIDYGKIKEFVIDAIDAVFLPGLMMVGQRGVGAGLADILSVGNTIIGYTAKEFIQIWQSDVFQYWDTLGGTRYGTDRRSFVLISSGAEAVVSGTAMAVSFSAATAGVPLLPVGGVALTAGGSIVFFISGVKLYDSVVNFVGALSGDSRMMDYSAFRQLLGQKMGAATDAAWAGANVVGSSYTIKDMVKMGRGFKNYRSTVELIKELVSALLDSKQVFDYFRR